jgi:hypothetical protein
MKFTRRQNGHLMTTIVLRRHYTREDVAQLLGWHAVLNLADSEDGKFRPPWLTVTQLEKIAREQADRDRDENLYAWSSPEGLGYELGNHLTREIIAWATEQAARL